jgi:hypothetical protein
MHPDDQELLLDSLDACEEYTAQTLELESGIRAELESLTLDELFALLGQTEEDWSAALERRQNIAMRNILRLIVYNRQSGMTNVSLPLSLSPQVGLVGFDGADLEIDYDCRHRVKFLPTYHPYPTLPIDRNPSSLSHCLRGSFLPCRRA